MTAPPDDQPSSPSAIPWGTVTFAAAVSVYLLTLSHDVGTWDIAEFQTIPHLFGVAHPTGYPLFTIIGGIWSWVPIGDMATRMNLLSAVLFAAAAAVTCRLAIRLGARGALATTGALTFAFATGTWRNATHIEVQSLHLLLLALLLLAWVVAHEDPSPRHVAHLCAVSGIGAVHHGLMIITAIPLLMLFAVLHRRTIAIRATLVRALPALVLPLTLLLYLPLRDSSAPLLNSDPTDSWWHNIRGEGFRGSIGTWRSLGIWWRSIDEQVSLLDGWMGAATLLLAVLGVGVLFRRSRAASVALLAAGLLASYAQVNSTDSNSRYVISTVLVVAIFAAVGAEALVSTAVLMAKPTATRSVAIAGVLLLVLLPINAVRANFDTIDDVSTDRNRRNGTALLEALPQNCVLWSYWDLRTQLFYLRYIEGVRPDITILDHRSTRRLGSSFAVAPTDLYRGVTASPSYAGRPVCFVPFPGRRAASDTVRATVIAVTERPWGLRYLQPGAVYLLEAREGP